ncbi:MAG: hypothetical protein D8M58_05760 [Calditrichaeota bacterium]|nr:MAG: hypothetical protein DWQ03_20745 [Calditrichota bacterium]MBL1204883.1 hypothetical protein [Calditrichota bacterium]NOG44712.1 hypothetical protein [Calditrichota bacterium]
MIINKVSIFVALLLANGIVTYGQDISIRIGTFYSSYGMSELKNVQKEIADYNSSSLNVPISKIKSFPSYFSFELQTGTTIFKNVNVGILFNYSSTGARSGYIDYSGEYKTDYWIEAETYGIFLEINLNKSEYADLLIGNKFLLINSSLEIIDLLTVWDESIWEDNHFQSQSFGFSPYVAYQLKLKFLTTRLELNYLVDNKADLHHQNNNKSYLLFRNRSKVGSDWSGFRIGLTFGLAFNN